MQLQIRFVCNFKSPLVPHCWSLNEDILLSKKISATSDESEPEGIEICTWKNESATTTTSNATACSMIDRDVGEIEAPQ